MLHQGRIEEHFFKFIERTSDKVVVLRPAKPTKLVIDETLLETSGYPITVEVQSSPTELTNGHSLDKYTVKCRYLIGYDGARS